MGFIFLRIRVLYWTILSCRQLKCGNLIHRVYHFSHNTQVNHVSIVSLNLLHQHLGHPSFHVLNRYTEVFHSFGTSSNSCNIFLHAKQSRNSSPFSTTISSDVFHLVYCDIWGPYNKKSICGSSYFLTILDDHPPSKLSDYNCNFVKSISPLPVTNFLILPSSICPYSISCYVSCEENSQCRKEFLAAIFLG